MFYRFTQLANINKDRILQSQSTTDDLTLLLNRRQLFSRLERLVCAQHTTIGLFMIDIDFFKQFNDTYGHLSGDDCLRNLGSLFNEFGEEHDVAFYRYGGEEFIMIGKNFSNEQLEALAQSLRITVERLGITHVVNPSGHITISIGCSTHSTPVTPNLAAETAPSAKSALS